MTKYSYEELVQMLQEFKIDHLQFVMNSKEHRENYLQWCKEHNCRASADSAEFYLDQIMLTAEEQQELLADNYEY